MSNLDLNDPMIIYMLIALDTELNQLHRLCIEQGPFFKDIFLEMTSDTLRQNLKMKCHGAPANASHVSRSHWKPAIPVMEIINIHVLMAKMLIKWQEFCATTTFQQFTPPSVVDICSPMTILDKNIHELIQNIIFLCMQINLWKAPKRVVEPHKREARSDNGKAHDRAKIDFEESDPQASELSILKEKNTRKSEPERQVKMPLRLEQLLVELRPTKKGLDV